MPRLLVLAVVGLLALRQVVSDWRLAASGDLGPNGDIAVYIGAINHLEGGGALYDFALDSGYGFTYPPFAAIALCPLTWLSPSATGLAWLTLCLVVALVVVALVVRSRPVPRRPVDRAIVLLLAATAFLGSVQVQSDLIAGQVNLVLALLLLLDLGRVLPDRWRGVLVGLAAAIKLTPMIVWGWFLLTRQWRALANSVGTFLACAASAWVVLPGDSVRFWTATVFDTGRVGDVELRFNASVMGTLARAGVDGSARTALWLLVGGVIVLAAYWHAERSRRRGDSVAAAVLLGCAAVVATPVAWPHHQIWLPLAGIILLLRGRRLAGIAGSAIVLFAYLHIAITRWSDARGLGWLFDNVEVSMFVGVCLFGLAPGRASTGSDDR